MAEEKAPKDEKPEITNENILGEKSEDIQRVSLVSSSPSARSIVRVVVIVLLLLAVKDFLGIVLSSLTYLFFMIVLAIFFAYLINPLVDLIQRPFVDRTWGRIMPRSLAIGISFLIVFSVLAIGIYWLAPGISQQARKFVENGSPKVECGLQCTNQLKEVTAMGRAVVVAITFSDFAGSTRTSTPP